MNTSDVSTSPTSQDQRSKRLFSTEYQDRYLHHKYQYTPQRVPPRHLIINQGACSNQTESREQYTEKPIPKRYVRFQQPYVQNPNKLSSVTGYQDDYPKWNYQRPALENPPKPKLDQHVFDATSTNKSDYRKWDIPKRNVPAKSPYEPTSHKLESMSSYRIDFCTQSNTGSCRRASFKPENAPVPSRPFVGISEYAARYK